MDSVLWIFVSVVLPLFHVAGIVCAIDSIMHTRTPQGTIAWVVALIAFPLLAVPLYLVLGRSKFQGYVTARQTHEDLHGPIVEKIGDQLEPFLVPESDKSIAMHAAELLADVPAITGNQVELLIDGKRTFESIFAGIAAARQTILFQFFIIKDDQLGREAKSRLIEKAKEGVAVYFLYDEVGSHKLPASYLQELRSAGVKVTDFNTRKGPRNRFQINFRNHRKVVVVDGETCWIGGHNVGDEYLGKDPEFGHWRDTHVRIQGPVALAAQLSFFEDWHWATGEVLDFDWSPRPSEGDATVLIIPTGPADPRETAALMFHHAINTATERIWIASPYFVPDGSILSALQLARLRGVDVRILIPDKPDHLLVYLAAFSYFEDLRIAGVKFYRYTKGFLHEKALLIDRRTAAIGTANFDNRSFRLNFEITAAVANESFVEQAEKMFEEDFQNSRLMEHNELENRSFLFKLGVRLARLTAPIQ